MNGDSGKGLGRRSGLFVLGVGTFAGDVEALEGTGNSDDDTAVPGQRGAVNFAAKSVQVPGDRRGDHAAGCTGAGRKTVDLTKGTGSGSGLLDKDQKKRVEDDGE